MVRALGNRARDIQATRPVAINRQYACKAGCVHNKMYEMVLEPSNISALIVLVLTTADRNRCNASMLLYCSWAFMVINISSPGLEIRISFVWG